MDGSNASIVDCKHTYRTGGRCMNCKRILESDCTPEHNDIKSLRAANIEHSNAIADIAVALNCRPDPENIIHAIQSTNAALTPSAETKSAYIGEFEFRASYRDVVTVPWTTIKDIMAAIRKQSTDMNKNMWNGYHGEHVKEPPLFLKPGQLWERIDMDDPLNGVEVRSYQKYEFCEAIECQFLWSASQFPVKVYKIEDGKAVPTDCETCVSDDQECESCDVFKKSQNTTKGEES